MQTARSKTPPAPAKTGRETDAYLRRLGERVRTLRNQRGMSRKVLAKQAKVSPTAWTSGAATMRHVHVS